MSHMRIPACTASPKLHILSTVWKTELSHDKTQFVGYVRKEAQPCRSDGTTFDVTSYFLMILSLVPYLYQFASVGVPHLRAGIYYRQTCLPIFPHGTPINQASHLSQAFVTPSLA